MSPSRADAGLGPGAEFDAIRQLLNRWGARATGIGDDAAVLAVPRGDLLVASVDTAVEGVHFKRDWLSPREIGYRSVAAALSDLAAMAARPLGVLVAFTLPNAWRDGLLELADGVGDAVEAAHTTIQGGNLSGGDLLSITTTVLGSAFAPLRRDAARPGHRVYVTGRLGGARAAVRELSEGRLAGSRGSPYRARFANPVPRLDEARWLADRGASAAIDVSDGLIGDLRHLAAASRVEIEIDAARVPRFGDIGVEDALQSGEEYELVVTAARAIDTQAFEARFGIPLSEIGTVAREVVSSRDEQGASGTVHVSGARVAPLRGYDHFSG